MQCQPPCSHATERVTELRPFRSLTEDFFGIKTTAAELFSCLTVVSRHWNLLFLFSVPYCRMLQLMLF